MINRLLIGFWQQLIDYDYEPMGAVLIEIWKVGVLPIFIIFNFRVSVNEYTRCTNNRTRDGLQGLTTVTQPTIKI